jgi:hypothetical protein
MTMNTLIRSGVAGQYGAALEMLRECLVRADAVSWLGSIGRFPFWHVAYHTLYITDLYLSAREAAFRPQPFHREDYDVLGPPPGAAEKKVVVDRPYDRETLLGYAGLCRRRAKRAVEEETDADWAGPSGFSWLPFSRLELHLYNIRHLQHHTGQLAAALRRSGDCGVRWALTTQL